MDVITPTLAMLSSKERLLLVTLADHVHFVFYWHGNGETIVRRRRDAVGIRMPRLHRLYRLGLINIGREHGDQAIVLTPIGSRLAEEICAARRRRGGGMRAIDPARLWWLRP